MKKVLSYIGIGLLLGLASCGKNTNAGDKATQDGPHKIRITVKATRQALQADGQAPSGDTRVTVDGTAINWAENDSFLLMDDVGGTYKMDIVDGAGTPNGTFTGEVDSNSERTYFMAISPYMSNTSLTTSMTISVPADQVQAGATDPAGFGSYMFFLGGGSNPDGTIPIDGDSQGDLSINFIVVSAIWDIIITNPSNLSIKSVKVRASDTAVEPFITSIAYDFAASPQTQTPTYSNYIATTLTTPLSDGTVTARLALTNTNFEVAPTDLQIEVTLDNGLTYVFYRPGVNKWLLNGYVYHSSVDMSAPDDMWSPLPI